MSDENSGSKGKLIIKKQSLAIILIFTLFAGALGGVFAHNLYVTKNEFKLIKTEDFEVMNGVYNKYAKLEMRCV